MSDNLSHAESGGLFPGSTATGSTGGDFNPEQLEQILDKGYPKVAWIMAKKEFSGLAIFRKFGDLNMLNLLSLQAELLGLRAELQHSFTQPDNLKYAYSFKELRKDDDDSEDLDPGEEGYEPNMQQKLMTRIQEKLHLYNQALWDVSQLESLDRPDKRSLKCLQLWMIRYRKKDEANGFLRGTENFTWNGTDGLEDFVAVRAPRAQNDNYSDKLTPRIAHFLTFFRKTAPEWCIEKYKVWRKSAATQLDQSDPGQSPSSSKETLKGAQSEPAKKVQEKIPIKQVEKSKEEVYNDKEDEKGLQIHSWAITAGRISAFFISLLAALFPVASMIGLYFIADPLSRMLAITGLTVAFALALKFSTSATSSEIFAVTAAYVAVEVVFVGSPPAGSSSTLSSSPLPTRS